MACMGSIRYAMLAAMFCATPILAQTAQGKSTAQAGANSRACKLLSVSDLEAYFGGTSVGVKGMDLQANSMCAYRFLDARHQVTLEVHPRSAAEDGMTPQQR